MRFLFLLVLAALLGTSCKKEMSAPKVAKLDSVIVNPQLVEQSKIDGLFTNSLLPPIQCTIECSPNKRDVFCPSNDGCAVLPIEHCNFAMDIKNNGRTVDFLYKIGFGPQWWNETIFNNVSGYTHLYDYQKCSTTIDCNLYHVAIPRGYDNYSSYDGLEIWLTVNKDIDMQASGLHKQRIEGYILNGTNRPLSSLRLDLKNAQGQRVRFIHIEDGTNNNLPAGKAKPFALEYCKSFYGQSITNTEFVGIFN